MSKRTHSEMTADDAADEKERNSPPKKIQRIDPETEDKDSPPFFQFQAFGMSDKGKKQHMEDRRIFFPRLGEDNAGFRESRYALFGIIDGHGGEVVAEYVLNHLPQIMINVLQSRFPHTIAPQERTDIVKKMLIDAFHACDASVLKNMPNMMYEGATTTVGLIAGNTFWCAGIGDSKAVLGRISKTNPKEIKALPLTKDHTCILLNELRRIESNGGRVEYGRVNGILEVTRSFGDPKFKKFGVIATPQVAKFVINERDRFVVIACDGLWSVFSTADAVQFVYDRFNHPSQPDIKKVTRALLVEAILNKRAKDNVSALIVKFTPNEGR